MKFADVRNDIAFRKIFGSEEKKEVLISFLNAVLGFTGEQLITEVSIVNPFLLPSFADGKLAIIDVKATDQSGRHYIVEMQVLAGDGFEKRALYYVSKSYSSQIKRGDAYRLLRPAIFIGILNFSQTQNTHYHSRNFVFDTDTGERTIKDMEFHFIELPKFTLERTELVTLVDKWVYFIKNAENLDLIPDDVTDTGLKIAYETANQETWTKAERDAYDDMYVHEEDARAVLDRAMQDGKAAGEKKKETEAVLGLHENGVPVSVIAKSLHITEAAVVAIIDAHENAS